jgi:hypothetical protein
MANLKLTLACWDYDRTRPLIDGRVKPEGIDLQIEVLRPRQAFQRMLDEQAFQVSELSLASYTTLKARGPVRSWPCRSRCRKSSVTPASMSAKAPVFPGHRTCAASGSERRNGVRRAFASCAAFCSTITG